MRKLESCLPSAARQDAMQMNAAALGLKHCAFIIIVTKVIDIPRQEKHTIKFLNTLILFIVQSSISQ